MAPRKFDGHWTLNHNTGVYIGEYIGIVKSSGHARGRKVPRHTTTDQAILLRLRFGDGKTFLAPFTSLTQTQNALMYASPPGSG